MIGLNKDEHLKNQVLFVSNEDNFANTVNEENDTFEEKAKEMEFKLDLHKR
jgi:hypothetical protein